MFIVFIYNSFYLCKTGSDVSTFIYDLSKFSVFFLAESLSIFFIFLKNHFWLFLFSLLLFCFLFYLCSDLYYFLNYASFGCRLLFFLQFLKVYSYWFISPFLTYIFTTINFHISIAFDESHEVLYIVLLFSFILMHFLIFLVISSLTHCFFKLVFFFFEHYHYFFFLIYFFIEG